MDVEIRKWNLGISGRHKAATMPRYGDLSNQYVTIDHSQSPAEQGHLDDGKHCRITTYA
jgi:hypothetical protein